MLKSIRLIIIISVFGTLVSCGPSENQIRIWNSDAKSNLYNVFLACKAFWANEGFKKKCTPAIAGQPDYGYIQSADVTISGGGSETDFSATAKNVNSDKTFQIDFNGDVSEVG